MRQTVFDEACRPGRRQLLLRCLAAACACTGRPRVLASVKPGKLWPNRCCRPRPAQVPALLTHVAPLLENKDAILAAPAGACLVADLPACLGKEKCQPQRN